MAVERLEAPGMGNALEGVGGDGWSSWKEDISSTRVGLDSSRGKSEPRKEGRERRRGMDPGEKAGQQQLAGARARGEGWMGGRVRPLLSRQAARWPRIYGCGRGPRSKGSRKGCWTGG
jgi:hypothetical protein